MSFLFFFLFEIADVTMTCIGLATGNYQHYNPVGIWIYENSHLLLFIVYRAALFYVIYRIFRSKLMHPLRYPLVIIGLYIYLCAIMWDLHTFSIINLYQEPLYTLLRINKVPLEIVFKILGVL